LAVGGVSYEGIRVALTEIEQNYLRRWAAMLRGSESLRTESGPLVRSRPTSSMPAGHRGFWAAADIAACYRLRPLFSEPRRLLLDLRAHAAESLRRLYRQRNLVLHGGRTEAVALGAALRTASPLVGAGIDRIVHGALVKDLAPLELLAKAEFEIDRAGSEEAPAIVDLLE